MKINEVVALHPAVAAKAEYDMLLHAGEEEMDDIIAFIMDDRNAEERRLAMLKHLDSLLGGTQDEYGVADLQNFMYDQEAPPEGPKKPHLSVVEDEYENTGEYEVCGKCGAAGTVYWDHTDSVTGEHVPAEAPCPDCEGGLKDITGIHKVPNFDDYKE